ncbi:MAG: DUF2587 domain-containing protein [Actinobacteria bacterium]|nr:DUF2587 domain-containing protein [Actinomycetota bacterium]
MSDADTPTAAPEVIEPDSVDPPDGPHSAQPAGNGAVTFDAATGDTAEADAEEPDINSPAKIIRIGAMVKQMLDEVRSTSLDEASRGQLRDIYERSLDQLKSALSPELAAELEELSFDFADDTLPSEVELRLAQSQLVGWLEGLFHGIQAALMAQQMSARQQLEGMRGQLMQGPGVPPGAGPGPGPGYI